MELHIMVSINLGMGFYEVSRTSNSSPIAHYNQSNQSSPKMERPASGYFLSPKNERPKTGYGRRNSETPRPSTYEGDQGRPDSRYSHR